MRACAVFCLAVSLAAVAADRETAKAGLAAAQTALAAGDYVTALRRAEESAAAFHAANDLPDETLAVNAAGSAQLYLGNYEGALAEYQKALALDRRQGDAKGEITRLSNIGSVHFFRGRYLDALGVYQQALRKVEQTRQEAWNAEHRQLVFTNLAMLHEQLGQDQKALDYYGQALALGPVLTPLERGQLLTNIGALQRRMGNTRQALESYTTARQVFQQDHVADSEINMLQEIGILQMMDAHDDDAAIRSFSEALKLAQAGTNRREIARAHLFHGEALYRTGHADTAAGDFSAALSTAREIGAREQWIALYGMARSEAAQGDDAQAQGHLEEAASLIQTTRSGAEDASSLKAEFLPRQRAVFDAQIARELRAGSSNTERLFGMLELARSRNLQVALRPAGTAATLRAVQAKLEAGTLLVEYWMGSGQLAALWATREKSGVVSRPWSETDTAGASEWMAALQQPGSDWRRGAERLGNRLLSGIPLATGVNHLLIVPDGILCAIPFEALNRSAGSPLLIESHRVSYLPSAAFLTREPAWRTPTLPWQRRLEAFGDPLLAGTPVLPEDQRWTRLPESSKELSSIAGAMPGSVRIHAGADNLKGYLASSFIAPLLHFSSHAVSDTLDPNRSRILFTAVAGSAGSEYLFRSEAQDLPLVHTDMVTLSACETGGGRLHLDEGAQSLSRAFLAAGARSTVTPLWSVEGGPTADFMRHFYGGLGRGESRAEALRAAKLEFLRSGASLAQPRYWAAFILNGDGQPPVRAALSWLWIAGPSAIVVVLVLLYLRRLSAGARRGSGPE